MKTHKAHHRNAERAELKRLLETGINIQMLGPRRIGKTWVIGKLAEDLRRAGWLCISIDVQGKRTEEEFFRTLCEEIEKHQHLHTTLLSHALERFRHIAGGANATSLVQLLTVGINPKQFSENLIESLNNQEQNAVILIDELSLFVMDLAANDADSTRAFLYHLRNLREGNRKVRWLFTGSIGLDVIGRRLGLQGALVDLRIFGLQPFTHSEARAFVEELGDQKRLLTPFEFNDGAFEKLARELGWLAPYYLDLLANSILPSFPADRGRPAKATVSDIDAALDKILGPSRRGYFATWTEHLEKNFPKEQTKQLHAILDILCENPDGEQVPTILTRLCEEHPRTRRRELMDRLTDLASGGFLEESEERWRFRSGLLRRYWAKWIKS